MNEFSNMVGLAVAILLVGAFGYGAADAVSEKVIQYKRGEDWNKRGYVRCRDGHLEIGNIDISDIHIPDGEYAIKANPEWCGA